LQKSQYSSKKTNVCPNNYKSLTVGLGGSAGLESPIVVAGAFDQIMRSYKLSYKDRTLLIGCGVAAGIAAV
jgi:CIC family chloride channel protein